MASSAVLVLLAFAAPSESAPLFRLQSSLKTSNWVPVEREIMRDVVTDSAVSQLTSEFDFMLVSAQHPRADSAQVLRIDATLIEPAENISVVAETVFRGQTRQAEVLANIETDDHRTVVVSLARAGRTVAKRLAEKLHPDTKQSDPISDDHIQTQRLLNQAAQLKREGKYEQSYSSLRLILSQDDLSPKIRTSVEEELHFRVPMYQAQDLMNTYRGLSTPEDAKEHYEFIESILRKTLDHNLGSPDKQRKINQRLDTLYQIRKYKLRSMKAQARSRLGRLKTSLTEYMYTQGSISEDEFEQLAKRMQLNLKIKDFQSSESGRQINALIHTESGHAFQVRFHMQGGVTIKDAESGKKNPD